MMGPMHGIRTLTWALAATLAVAGCTIDAPDFAAKQCPCAPGYVCDAAQDVCVPGPASGNGGNAGAVTLASFQAIWTTPQSIRWRWEPGGDESAFSRYELWTATSTEALLAGEGTVWTATENPELGVYRLPHTGLGDVVIATTTDGHEPLTEIFAQLIATDTQQRSSVSNVASASTTLEAYQSVPLYVDWLGSGDYLVPPDEALISEADPYAGEACIAYPHDCDTGVGTCPTYVGINGLNADLHSPMSTGDFATTAYLELAIAHDSPAPSFWSTIRIRIGSGETLRHLGYAPFTIRAGDYRLYQVPLRVLRHPFEDGAPLTFADLQDGLFEVATDGDWGHGATIRIDEVSVKW